MAPIHILHIIGDPAGGVRKHVHAIIMGLDARIFRQSYAYSTVRADARFHEEIVDVRRHLAGELPLTIRKKPGVDDILNLWRLRRFVRRCRVDIVHGHGAKGGFYARLVSRLCGIRSVYTPHGGAVHRMFSPAADRVYTAVEKWLFSMTDYFLFESRYTAEAYRAKIGKKPKRWKVNYNGIEMPAPAGPAQGPEPREYGESRERALRIGVFGMLRPEKGQDLAIRAVAELIGTGKPIVLHVFGEGPDRGRLEELTAASGLHDRIFFHGDVADAERHLSAMDVVLIPSRFESFGYVAIEAMALRKPVIASRTGGLPEIIEDRKGGVLVPPENVPAIVDAVSDCLAHPEKFREYAAAGFHRFQEHFTAQQMIREIGQVYRELQEENPD